MSLTLLVLLLVAFIPFQVYKAVVAWRLTKGIKEFKERNFKGALPPFDPVPSELKSFSILFVLIVLLVVSMLDSWVIPYVFGGLIIAAIIPEFFFNKDIPEGVPEKPCSEPGEVLFGCDVLIHDWWVQENPHALWEYGYKEYGKIMVGSIIKIVTCIALVVLAVVSPNANSAELMPDTKVENGKHQTVTVKYNLLELKDDATNPVTTHKINGAGVLPSDKLTDTGDKKIDSGISPLYMWAQEGDTPGEQEVYYSPDKYFIAEDQEPGKAYVEYTPLYRVRLTVFDGQPLCVEGRNTDCWVNAWDAKHSKITFHVPKGEAAKYIKKRAE